LKRIFNPIAPTIRVFTSESRPELPAELLKPHIDGLQVARWNHFGVGLGPGSNIYHDEVTRSPVSDDELPRGYRDPAHPFEVEIGRGVTGMVPLTLYAD